MRNPFSSSPAHQPFLSPLGRQRRLPSIAAPAILTLCGGAALIFAFGTTLFGLQSAGIAPAATEADVAEAAEQRPPARIVSVERARDKPAEEEPALVTALPQSPITESGEVVLEPVQAQGDAALAADADADPDPTAAIPLPAEITAFAPQPRPAPPAPARAPAQAASAGNASTMRAAVVRRAVNMRAAPKSGAQVLGVVPASSEIRAETNCGWCRIDYQGRSGFIYKSFIDYR